MKLALTFWLSILAFPIVGACLMPAPAYAVVCARGVYRAGCAGPNRAAVVRRPPATVNCARGPYRAGCAGPNGAVVRRY
jgi:hypothetical protein